MSLSSEIISQFAKLTTEEKETNKETTVYGTIVYDGKPYVKLDGSDLLTPISTTTDVTDGERVTVMIKNHTATVTGNMSSPAARTDDVKEIATKISEFEIVIADKVSTKEFDAEVARIDTLVADNITIKGTIEAGEAEIADLKADNVTIKDKLEAGEAAIENLEATKIDAEIADLKYASAENLEATNINVNNLEATYAEFSVATAEKLDAHDAAIKNLDSKYATIENLNVEKGRIDDLEVNSLKADSAVIKNLESDIADIDTLIFGSASGDVIQTSFANAVIAQLGNAQIKSAMIKDVSADKITAGDIITNNVRVMSEDGKLLISDETIQISDSTRVRVQIGKDSAGDYSINIWDADGNLMFSEGGITDNAIKEAIIRNDMVRDDANISASKLDINSLFEEINGSSKTINSSKIYLNDKEQTLDVAFTSLTTDVDGLQNDVSSQGTQLSVIRGEIDSKVWQQDIDAATGEMNSKYSSLEQNLNGFKTTVSETYSTKKDLENVKSSVTQNADHIESLVGRTTVVEDKFGNYSTTEEMNSAIEQKASSITLQVSTNYATKSELSKTDAKAEAAQDDINNLEIGGRNLILGSDAIATKDVSEPQPEFIQYTDLAPIFDEHGLIEYTLSFDIKSADITNRNSVLVYCQNGSTAKHSIGTTSVPVTTEYVRHHITFIPSIVSESESKSMLAFYGTYNTGNIPCVKNVKLEKGNKATDWTPSPDDVDEATKSVQDQANKTDEALTEALSKIQVLEDQIHSLVVDKNGASLMTQTENGWVFSTGSIQDAVDAASESLGNLTTTIGDVEATVGVLDAAVKDLGVLSEYINIGTYTYADDTGVEQTEPSIDLGERDTGFRLKITNTRIFFTDGTTGLVSINSKTKTLEIEKAEVKGELMLSGFVWKKRNNGNLGLAWKGGVS